MIGRLTGIVAEKAPPQVLIDVGGVGYEVDVPMSTFFNLPGLGEKVTLLTHFVVREDAQLLYGFLSAEERQTFRELVKISGIGPRTALSVLSGMSIADLYDTVAAQDSARLVKVPGIGKIPGKSLLGAGLVLLALIILGSVPLALVGSVAALWLAGQPLSVASMIGFITLTGTAATPIGHVAGVMNVSNAGTIVKNGAAAQTIDNALTNTGTVAVNGGTLTITLTVVGIWLATSIAASARLRIIRIAFLPP